MAEEFADVYYCGGHVCRVGRTGMAKWSNLLQHDLSDGVRCWDSSPGIPCFVRRLMRRNVRIVVYTP